MKINTTLAPHWEDTKRWLGMPITFTHYYVNSISISVLTGIFKKKQTGCKLHQIEEITYTKSLFQRLFGLGTVKIVYNTPGGSSQKILLENIANPRDVKDLIEILAEEAILRRRYPHRNLTFSVDEPDDRLDYYTPALQAMYS